MLGDVGSLGLGGDLLVTNRLQVSLWNYDVADERRVDRDALLLARSDQLRGEILLKLLAFVSFEQILSAIVVPPIAADGMRLNVDHGTLHRLPGAVFGHQ